MTDPVPVDVNADPQTLGEANRIIGALKTQLDVYVRVASAVFARGIMEDFLKKYLQPYISVHTAAGIEAAYIQFLADSTNDDARRMNSIIQNRMSRMLCEN